jgi:NAD+ synthase (glutamine-hydrolysing)
VVHKTYLPNYSVFDEERYFRAGGEAAVFHGHGARFGVSICEDIWYPTGPPELQARAGAELLVNLSASPYVRDKVQQRQRMLATRAADNVAFVVYCNLVGGQDELVFDGNSLVIGPTGDVLARGASFEEDIFLVELNLDQVFHERLLDPRDRKARWTEGEAADAPSVFLPPTASGPLDPRGDRASIRALPDEPEANEEAEDLAELMRLPRRRVPSRRPIFVDLRGVPGPGTTGGARGELSRGPEPLGDLAEVWAALVLGTRDYVLKNGFREVVIGLSGGIDSAICAALAADALGPQNVVGVGMPARYSSPSSLADARALAELRGMRFLEVPIDDVFQANLDMLAPAFAGREPDVTEENLQSRIRGNVLMALSNKFGWLVITTGNKSETSVGYSTLYGDTAGGFAPIKDVSKLLVYELVRWRNEQPDGPVIPEHSITRAPSAELRPDQTDQDSLPPYEILDPILTAYVEEEMSVEEIVAMGHEPAMVARIARLVDRAEYKRRQAPPGIKISGRAFGRDRRMPITKRVTRID